MVRRFFENTEPTLLSLVAVSNADQFCEAVEFDQRRSFNLSVSGTFAATIVLQRSFDDGNTWVNVWQTTEPAEKLVDTVEPGVLWRAGCPAGAFTSGVALARLSQ